MFTQGIGNESLPAAGYNLVSHAQESRKLKQATVFLETVGKPEGEAGPKRKKE